MKSSPLPLAYRLMAFFIGVSSCLVALAQPTGTISGTVTNADGQPLEFAVVAIRGTPLQATTGRGGEFRLSGVNPGQQAVEASYTGLDTSVSIVEVAAGGETRTEFALKPSSIVTLAAFTVTGERSGSAAAVQQQRKAMNTMSVITADQFGGVADGRIDDALKRIPGIGFQTGTFSIRGVPDTENSITVDGVRLASASAETRRVETDRIPGDRVSRIEVSKALLPDMEADAVGGTINLVSKSAFDRPKGELAYVFAISGLSGLQDDPEPGYIGSLAYSNVLSAFGGKDNLGIDFSVSVSEKPSLIDLPFEGNEMINFFSNTPAVDPATLVDGTSYPINFRLRKRVETISRQNVGLRVDYKLSPESSIWVNTFRNERTVEASTKNTRLNTAGIATILPVDAAGNPLNPAATGVLAGFQTFGQTRLRNAFTGLDDEFFDNDSEVWFFSAGGNHRLREWHLTWNAAWSRDLATNRNANLVVRGRNATHATIDRTGDPLRPRVIYTGGETPVVQSLANIASAAQNRNITDLVDELGTLKADLTREFATRFPIRLKAGGQFRRQERENNPVSNISYNWAGGPNFSAFADKPINPFGIYPDDRLSVSSERVLADIAANPSRWTFDATTAARNARANDGLIEETITSGYVMGTVRIGKLSLAGGVRYEGTEVEGSGYSFRGAQAGVPVEQQYTPVRTKGDYSNVFPSFFGTYEIRKGLQLRGSASQGIGRPAFGNLRPTTTIAIGQQQSGAPGRITQANPSLKPQFTDNFDLGLEHYFEPAGMVSLNLFQKRIKDFQTTTTEFIGSNGGRFGAEFAGYELFTRINAGDADVEGFELAYQQQFTFLPGWLSALGAFANWSHVKAVGNIPGTAAVAGALQNYVPDTVNLGLSYQRHPLSVRVLGFWRSDYIVQYFPLTPTTDYLRKRIFDMDLKIEYTLHRHLSLFLDVNNLLESQPVNAQGNRFNDHALRPAYIYARPRQFEAGVRGHW